MCLNKNCCSIDIIEIHDNIKVVIHYDTNKIPFFIQYWDETKPIHEELNFKEIFEP